jgi:DNA-nicking Smr family endonuclease
MAKKIRQHTPPKPPQFVTTPFSALKGVALPNKPATVEPPVKASTPLLPEENGADLFFEAMAGTKRLHDSIYNNATTGNNRSAEFPPKKRVVASLEETAADELFIQEISRLKLEVRFSETLPEEDELKPLSGNRLKQLKRGIITVGHQLDLHGLTRDETLTELPRFLRSARLRGQAAALIITGKGNNSPAEPVLQQAVSAWLRDAGRELVVEYAPAPREMGGNGAFIVFLRPLPEPPAHKN